MKLHIKNMVCPRCILVVRQIFDELKIGFGKISLGEVELDESLSDESKVELSKRLKQVGFSLIDDRRSRMIDQIKQLVIDKVHHSSEEMHVKWADLIPEKLHYDYKYLSTLFSSVEGVTLEQYIIRQKIERVKELMVYDELTLSQISDQLGYSSVSHLSAQFKKVTGMNPSQFKRAFSHTRKGLDDID
jgi:AraC-like DNA-binding protein